MTRATAKSETQFKDYKSAMKVADQEPLGKPVWVYDEPIDPNDQFKQRKGHYVVKKLGPVAAAKRREQLEAAKTLREDFGLVPGATVYTILRHRSSSGMYRHISLMVKSKDGGMRNISYFAAKVLGDKLIDKGEYAIGVSGCGMDMGFHLVYNLGSVLYPHGFTCPGASKDRSRYCPSNEHVNPPRPKPRKGMKHKGDGGYSLRHSWL